MTTTVNGLARVVVWLVDAQPLRRAGLRAHLSSVGFTIGGEGNGLDDARAAHEKHADPDIILLDFAQGSDAVAAAAQSHPKAKIITLADHVSIAGIKAAFAAGASGYLSKSITPVALSESLRLALTGEKILPGELSQIIMQLPEDEHRPPTAPTAVGGIILSPQELEITRCIAAGCPNKTIAQDLSITESTVKAHVKTLMRKIGVSNRTQAAIWAHSQGLQLSMSERGH